MKASSELAVKIKIVYGVLISRFVTGLGTYLLYNAGGFLTSTFKLLVYIMLPVSIMYIIVLGKFIRNNARQYPVKGPKLSPGTIGFSYYALVILSIAEILLICWKALSFGIQIGINDFLLYIVIIESMFGIIGGYYIADFFGSKVRNPA